VTIEQTILSAIAHRKLLAFHYQNLPRVVEPHVLGICGGAKQLLAYQLRGQSHSGGLPEWRRFVLREIKHLTVLDETFAGPRPYPSGQHSRWDRRIAFVS
jgi:predicted DNA-binding transcriptional regulator YafY